MSAVSGSFSSGEVCVWTCSPHPVSLLEQSRSGGDDAQAVRLHVHVVPWAAAFLLLNYSAIPRTQSTHGMPAYLIVIISGWGCMSDKPWFCDATFQLALSNETSSHTSPSKPACTARGTYRKFRLQLCDPQSHAGTRHSVSFYTTLYKLHLFCC